MAGSKTTEAKVPQYIEDAARQNLQRADYISTLGSVPYYGPDVAALTPLQEAAFGNTGAAASAYGLGSASPTAGMPQVQEYAGGVRGYSSAPMYEQAVSELQSRAPGLYDAIVGMFIDRQTGAQPQSPFAYDPERYTRPPETAATAPTYTGGGDDNDNDYTYGTQMTPTQAQQNMDFWSGHGIDAGDPRDYAQPGYTFGGTNNTSGWSGGIW